MHFSGIIPDRILLRMRPADRLAVGQDTAAEARKKGAARRESELQKLCEAELMRRNIAYLHLSPRAREKAGWPDLTFVVRGTPYAVELKTATGRLSADQALVLAQMRRDGWTVRIVRSFPEFLGVLNDDDR